MSDRSKIVLMAAVVLHIALLVTLANGFTDDGFIHIRYADNLINRGEYSFNTGEVSFGTTSPLWVLMLATAGKIAGGGERLILYSRLFSWLAGIATVLLMFVLARRVGVRPLGAAFCAVAFAAHVWFMRWTALSMETSLAVMAIAAVGVFSVRAHEDIRSAMLLGFFCGISALIRPEAYLLLPVLGAAFLISRGRLPLRNVIVAGSVAAALIGPWLVFAKLHIGHFLPNTAGAKSGGLVTNPVVFLNKLVPIMKIVGSAEIVAVVLVLLAAVVIRHKARMFALPQRFMLLWVVALPLAYVLFDIQVLSRYMLLTSPFTVVLGFLALEDLIVSRCERFAHVAFAAAAILAVAINLIVYVGVVVQPSRAFSRDLQSELRGLALYIHENSDDGAVVAAADIGYLSFYSQRRILDLGGLVDDTTSELREANSYEEIIQQGLYLELDKFPHVDFFIDRELEPNRFDGQTLKGYRFESIKVIVIDNLGIKKPGPYHYTLYRLHRS